LNSDISCKKSSNFAEWPQSCQMWVPKLT